MRVGRLAAAAIVALAATSSAVAGAAERSATIERAKASIVAVGTHQRARTPPFEFRGTGFVVGDGTLVATNAHVLPAVLDAAHSEALAIVLPAPPKDGKQQVQFREAHQVAVDVSTDLALIRISGPPLPALKLQEAEDVREGQDVLFTGFPIGPVLGLYPATHRAMIAAITPIAIARPRAAELDPATIRRLASGAFPVFQLDATAYPGNSGSPLYDAVSGEVLGVINSTLVKTTKEAVLTQPSGITYAIPARHLRALIDKAR
jgi:S1-C subfamily serine protease